MEHPAIVAAVVEPSEAFERFPGGGGRSGFSAWSPRAWWSLSRIGALLPAAIAMLTIVKFQLVTAYYRQRAKTKTSPTPLASPATRLVAAVLKATKRPFAERYGEPADPCVTLRSVVEPLERSRT